MRFKSLDDAAPPTDFAEVIKDVEKQARDSFDRFNKRFLQFPEVLVV